jgi:Xaa-Pro dipeptidase
MEKREFLKLAGASALLAAVGKWPHHASAEIPPKTDLSPITGDAQPISTEERIARVAKAQRLMAEHDVDAILLEPGPAMVYFTGVRWRRSERLTAAVIPREGEIAIVTPYFEEPSIRESMSFGDDVRTWHEHESPFERVGQVLRDRRANAGHIAIEDTVRYFVTRGLQEALPDARLTTAEPVTRGCRMLKSTHELRLMHKAAEVTISAYEHVWKSLQPGMTPDDMKTLMTEAQNQLGGSGTWAMVLLGEASAYPHGSDQPQILKEGQIVLMDCGTNVLDYASDISRTLVLGEPTKRQREVWDTVRRGQQIAFETAQLGTPAGAVDDAVRAYYESLGYGPGYQTPGLSHRTGHGIGMEGHEPVNFVHGETTPLSPGMCFSNEPGIYSFDEFGVRLEDCIYMTDAGAQWFSVPPESLESPVGTMGPKIRG